MNQFETKYYEELREYSERKIKEYSIDVKELLKIVNHDSNDFNLINFYLLTKSIISENNNNFQILIPDKYFKDDFFSPILLSVSVVKYKQNIDLFNSTDYIHHLKKGDVFYLQKKKTLCKYIGKQGDTNQFNFLKDDNAKTIISITDEQLSRLHKLRNIADFQYNGQAGTHFNNYLSFYQKLLIDFQVLVTFKRKTVIIAEQAIVNSLASQKDLPFRYNSEKNDRVPVKPLIEIFNSYTQAREYLYNNENTDEVIVIGYQKYQNCIGDLQNDQNKGKFNKLIIIGSKRVDSDNFKIWQWTTFEINTLSLKTINGKFEIKSLPPKQFSYLREELSGIKKELIELGIDQKEAESITNFFFNLLSRQLNVENPAIIQYINSIFDDPENDLYIALNEIGKPNKKDYFKTRYLDTLNKFLVDFSNPKTEYVLSQKNIDKNYFLITDKWQIDNLKNKLITNKLNISLVTNKNIEQIIKNSDDDQVTLTNYLNEEIKFSFSKRQVKRNVFIVPYIYFKYNNPFWYYHLYNKITEFGDVYVLKLSEIEDNRLNMFQTLYEKQNIYRLSHPDRLFWFENLSYPAEIEIDNETVEILKSIEVVSSNEETGNNENQKVSRKKLQRYFVDNFKIVSDFKNDKSEKDITDINENELLPTDNEPISGERYVIEFEDKTHTEVGEYEKLALKQSNSYLLTYAKELKNGAEIIEDWMLSLRDTLKVLGKYSSFNNEIKQINEASSMWQTWLNGLFENYKRNRTELEALKKLHERLNISVSIDTMAKWMQNQEPNFFPRANDDLQKIIDLKLALTPENNPENIAKKEKYKELANNIKQGSTALLYRIKKELTYFICNNSKGSVLNELDDTDLKNLLTKKKFNRIKNITKL